MVIGSTNGRNEKRRSYQNWKQPPAVCRGGKRAVDTLSAIVGIRYLSRRLSAANFHLVSQSDWSIYFVLALNRFKFTSFHRVTGVQKH